ncbi:MAG: rRNA maturation RNase YbeY [Microthrixaceae bacterium]
MEIDDRSGFELPEGGFAESLAELMSEVLAAEGVGDEASAGLHLVSADEITGLNESHMDANGATDVLSFAVDGADDSAPDGQPTLVGDVVLSPQVAAEQAYAHAGTLADECRLLVVHGSLHLVGWDHADEESRLAMWNRERQLLDDLDMSPPLDPWTTS